MEKSAYVGQRRKSVLNDIISSIRNLGFDAKISESALLGPILVVNNDGSKDKVVVALGDLDEFKILENSDQKLVIQFETRGKYEFIHTGQVEFSSRRGLASIITDFND